MYIKNASDLVENGEKRAERAARRLALDAVEAALIAVEPGRLVASKVRVSRDRLLVGDERFDLSRFGRVFVIGGGKASGRMASAIESLLGDRITGGVVNVPDSQSADRDGPVRIKLHAATHPLPSRAGVEGVEQMLELVGKPRKDDLVICLMSGGGSSLLPMPRDGISLEDKIEVTRRLLLAGATIQELNVVRKHLSGLKGGWLAERLSPSVVLSLVISDVVGNRLDSIASGPLYPDSSTFADAIHVLKKYRLFEQVPGTVSALLAKGAAGKLPETPKAGSSYFKNVYNIIIGSNEDASDAAVRYLKSKHQGPVLLTTNLEGEARFAGMFLGSVLSFANARPRPSSYVVGGETTVTVTGQGRGGRNQEFALGAAMKIDGNNGVALVSLGTDGLDGSTPAAGAIVDGHTMRRAKALALSPEEVLTRNDSFRFFSALGDLVMTGPTGTNVDDLAVGTVS
jgi:glycerate 2-kinase